MSPLIIPPPPPPPPLPGTKPPYQQVDPDQPDEGREEDEDSDQSSRRTQRTTELPSSSAVTSSPARSSSTKSSSSSEESFDIPKATLLGGPDPLPAAATGLPSNGMIQTGAFLDQYVIMNVTYAREGRTSASANAPFSLGLAAFPGFNIQAGIRKDNSSVDGSLVATRTTSSGRAAFATVTQISKTQTTASTRPAQPLSTHGVIGAPKYTFTYMVGYMLECLAGVCQQNDLLLQSNTDGSWANPCTDMGTIAGHNVQRKAESSHTMQDIDFSIKNKGGDSYACKFNAGQLFSGGGQLVCPEDKGSCDAVGNDMKPNVCFMPGGTNLQSKRFVPVSICKISVRV